MREKPAKAPPTDYTIHVHISGVHYRLHDVLYADATLNGKKVELMGLDVPHSG
jgi:hypothetical protein